MMIEKIIDTYLQHMLDAGLNVLPTKIPSEMLRPESPTSEEWNEWLPIKSTVTDSQIHVLETTFNFKFPESYKRLLKHKHFCQLGIHEFNFYEFPSDNWFDHFTEKYTLNAHMLEEGHIPFAELGDYGNSSTLCFNSNEATAQNEYSIWHWNFEEKKKVYENFETMLISLDNTNETFVL